MDMILKGRTALITGGTQGVGAAIAFALADAGANLVLHGLKEDELAKQTAQECRKKNVQVDLIAADLLENTFSSTTGLAEEAISKSRNIDLLINNAGIFIDRPFLEMDYQTYDRTMRLNVAAGYFLSQFFAKRWIENGISGRILFTGSINGLLAEQNHTAYDTSKAAVAGMVRSLCVALAPYNIRVNSIAPGLVRTPLTNLVLDDQPSLDWMKLHTPNGKVPNANVCGGAAVFLLSDFAEHIHGQTIYIDGGMGVWQQPDKRRF